MPNLELPYQVLVLGKIWIQFSLGKGMEQGWMIDIVNRCAGEAVTVEDEVVVINSIVLPHKTLNVSVQEEIIL